MSNTEVLNSDSEALAPDVTEYDALHHAPAPAEEYAVTADIQEGLTYTRADGTTEQAANLEEAMKRCPVLGKMTLEQANVLLELASIGQAKMAETATKHVQATTATPPTPATIQVTTPRVEHATSIQHDTLGTLHINIQQPDTLESVTTSLHEDSSSAENEEDSIPVSESLEAASVASVDHTAERQRHDARDIAESILQVASSEESSDVSHELNISKQTEENLTAITDAPATPLLNIYEAERMQHDTPAIVPTETITPSNNPAPHIEVAHKHRQPEAVMMTDEEILSTFPEVADFLGLPEVETIDTEFAEDVSLSAMDQEALTTFSQQLETASISDFPIVDLESHQEENIPPLDTTDQTASVEAHTYSPLPTELQPPAETSPTTVAMVEEITERIAMSEPDVTAEAHAALVQVDESLRTLERALKGSASEELEEFLASPVSPEQQTEVEAAKEALAQNIYQLCQTIGLEYSEKQITAFIEQLLIQPKLNPEAGSNLAEGAETLIAVNKGTHERLSWIRATVKHFKQQTNFLHRLLGRRALDALAATLPAA